jgi:hypothetical protein
MHVLGHGFGGNPGRGRTRTRACNGHRNSVGHLLAPTVHRHNKDCMSFCAPRPGLYVHYCWRVCSKHAVSQEIGHECSANYAVIRAHALGVGFLSFLSVTVYTNPKPGDAKVPQPLQASVA